MSTEKLAELKSLCLKIAAELFSQQPETVLTQAQKFYEWVTTTS